MQKRKKIWFAVILAFIAAYVVAFTLDISNQDANQDDVQLAVAPVVKKVMVIDVNNIGHIDEAGILSGAEPVLALQVKTDANNQQAPVLQLIDDFDAFKSVDVNSDGRIDAADPIYASLTLIFLDENGQPSRLVPLTEAGIRAIFWQKRFIVPQSLTRIANKLFKEQRKVLMSDGSTRKMRIIHVNEKILSGA